MNVKHTPGPWKVLPEEVSRPYIRIRGARPGDRYKVANVLTPTYDGVAEREAEETRANARLIAEAPMLAKALTDLLSDPANPAHHAIARTVLARAGVTP
ncbi:MAG: hypothetical protein E5299_01497 [Burkholderia gladioli]|nr:MAG: hypothetical protein E5299_01497 [Burkholderia gladioli]